MTQANLPQKPAAPGKGQVFFDRADQVAETGNWDFAIELYLEGISREPENIQRGHQPLREVSLKRKAQGGKGPGMMEKLKRRPGKDPVVNLVNCEYLLAKEPGDETFMEQVLQAARALELPDVIKWICDILLNSQRLATRKNKRLLLLLADVFAGMKLYPPAIEACEMARQLAPDDSALQDLLTKLGTEHTINKGGYDQDGSFTKGIKNYDEQKRLIDQDSLVKNVDYLQKQIAAARKGYEEAPTVPGKINGYVDALLAPEDEALEQQAIEVLNKAFEQSKAYQFKQRIGEIRIRQMTREYRAAAKEDPAKARELAKRQLQFELSEYLDRVANYPTNMGLRYELGRRQLASGQIDDAIGSLQKAQADPRHRVDAMGALGQAFAAKGWLREASETYEKALAAQLTEGQSKVLRYNLAMVLEKMGELKRAQDEYSTVAQIDFGYKEVRQRLEDVRRRLQENQP